MPDGDRSPEPVIDIAVEPKSKADQEKMGLALRGLRPRVPDPRDPDDRFPPAAAMRA